MAFPKQMYVCAINAENISQADTFLLIKTCSTSHVAIVVFLGTGDIVS